MDALNAQDYNFIEEDTKERIVIIGDTITGHAISLNEIKLLPKLKFDSSSSQRQYLILKRKTIKVYPYAKLAAERLERLNERIETLKTKNQRKNYTRRVQKFIENEFGATLKKFTITEGQILIKLIHRQTGATAFDLLKNLRSGWRAYWYNNTAKLFNMSLKATFDPMSVKEDYLIEDILQRLFQEETLDYQKPFIEHDLYELSKQWK